MQTAKLGARGAGAAPVPPRTRTRLPARAAPLAAALALGAAAAFAARGAQRRARTAPIAGAWPWQQGAQAAAAAVTAWPPVPDVRQASCRAGAPDAAAAAGAGAVTRIAALQALHELHRHPAGFRRLRVRGDGACMFRSVVQGDALLRTGSLLPEDQEWAAAQQLRADVVGKLRESREDIEPFIPGIIEGQETFEGYLERMARPGTWGGEPELAMAVKVLQRPIAVYSPAPTPQHIITYGEDLEEAPMHVLWSGAHYDLLVPEGPRSKL